ncbi:Tripartite tricarboxylate transporter family receptor [compost metagenome]
MRERKIKALAVTTAERLAVLPDVPTVADSGFPGFRAATWFGLAVPRAVPQAEAQRLQADVDAYVQEDRKRWGAVIEANRIRLD